MHSFEQSSCKNCDENCCSRFFIILEDVRDKDWLKWLSYHERVTIRHLDKKGRIQVWFDSPCTHLNEEGACMIYAKRPKMCRKFVCPKKSVL